MALRLLRILPASLVVSLCLKRGGGAKSTAVKVLDFLKACLQRLSALLTERCRCQIAYGLGITERSSKDEASGR